jgi:hypothetical protein
MRKECCSLQAADKILEAFIDSIQGCSKAPYESSAQCVQAQTCNISTLPPPTTQFTRHVPHVPEKQVQVVAAACVRFPLRGLLLESGTPADVREGITTDTLR